MEPLSQFYVLSPRGDMILSRDFRGDVSKGTNETFFRNVKFWNGKQQDAPPVFNVEGINYMYVKKSGLYFVATARFNVSPTFVVELMNRISKVFKDYCGVLNEEAIRKNFTLLYELIDEMIDNGYPQWVSTESLKSFVFNEPIETSAAKGGVSLPDFVTQKTTPSSAVDKPISLANDGNQKNEIFVDIYEKINITFNSSGVVLNSDIDGIITMKSYLAGNPPLKLALNEELLIGKKGGSNSLSVVCLDDCNFHECVNLDEFDKFRVLNILPPDGEFTVMNYRITSEFRAPFRIFPLVEMINPNKVELVIKVRADIPEQNYGSNVTIQFPVPKGTSGVSFDMGMGVVGQSTEYHSGERKAQWKIKKFTGGTEHVLRAKISLTEAAQASSVKRDIGPISMVFEIPMYNVSNLQVRYLRINENQKSYNPYRWVRYVTKSNAYVARV